MRWGPGERIPRRRSTIAVIGSTTLLVAASACSSGGPAAVGGSAETVSTTGPTTVSTVAVATTATTVAESPASTDASIPTTTIGPVSSIVSTTPYMVPLADNTRAGWGATHSGYPATDIFVACGAEVVAPVNGVVIDVRIVDTWDPAVDNPATRGGRSVAVLGDDGVRYYVAHLDEVDATLAVGEPVTIGQRLGTVGLTGRTSACHVHVGISPPCPGKEWSVRRGVVGPARYLDAWRTGEQLSPAGEVAQWVIDNPAACTDAMGDPNAVDS